MSATTGPRYGDNYDDMTRRCYFNYVRLYVPAGSELVSAEGVDPASVSAGPGENGTQALVGYFEMLPGASIRCVSAIACRRKSRRRAMRCWCAASRARAAAAARTERAGGGDNRHGGKLVVVARRGRCGLARAQKFEQGGQRLHAGRLQRNAGHDRRQRRRFGG